MVKILPSFRKSHIIIKQAKVYSLVPNGEKYFTLGRCLT